MSADIVQVMEEEGTIINMKILELYHDPSEMKSVACIEFEISYLQNLANQTTDNDIKFFYQDKIESLKSDKE